MYFKGGALENIPPSSVPPENLGFYANYRSRNAIFSPALYFVSSRATDIHPRQKISAFKIFPILYNGIMNKEE